MDGAAADALLARLADAGGSVLWLMHVGADPDCVGSAYALREAFGGTVGAPDGMNRPGERLARHLGLEVDTWPHPENHRAVVAVDLGSRSSLGRLAPRIPAPMLVDHHRYGDLHADSPAHAWDPDRASCCEVVLALLDRAGKAPSTKAAWGLLAGLVADTARMRHADAHALRAAARLSEMAGAATLAPAYAILEGEDDGEEPDTLDLRLASLKAAARATVEAVDGLLVATSHVGSFDAAAAAALVRAGADLAIVGQEKHDAARASLRASPRFLARGIHLGELVNGVGRDIGWSAGGHEGAAGLRGAPPLAKAQAALMARVRERLAAAPGKRADGGGA